MATLTLRGVPEELMERLRKRAEQDRRSVNAETIHFLEEILSDAEQREQRLAALERILERAKQLKPASVDSVELLREDRER